MSDYERKPKYFRFGACALSRRYCASCKEEMLHRYDKCIHCQHDSSTPKQKAPPWNGYGRQGKSWE